MTHTDMNVQTRQRRNVVRCRRCGKVLTAPESIAAGVGSDCKSAEHAGIATGRDWKLRVGDWVTFDLGSGAIGTGEIIAHDGWDGDRFRIEVWDGPSGLYDHAISVSRYRLRFVGIERPLSESELSATLFPDGDQEATA